MTLTQEQAAALAHEIRNPMSAIGNCIEILSKTLKLEGDTKELIEIALGEWERLNRLFTNFLALARQHAPRRAATDIHGILEKTLTLLQHDSRYNPRVRVERRYVESRPLVLVDPDQLSQVFWNIMLNAIQAMNGGTLTIETSNGEAVIAGKKHRCLRIGVQDTGCGMPPEIQKQALRPFFTTKEGGTGIGLAIVNQIVQAHDGVLLIESEAERGTKVSVFIPLPEAEEMQSPPAANVALRDVTAFSSGGGD